VFEGQTGSPLSVSVTRGFQNATVNADFDFCGGSTFEAGVWFSLRVPSSSGDGPLRVSVDTCTDTSIDTVMGVVAGENCGSNALMCECVGFSNDDCGYQSRVSFEAEAGKQVFVLVRPYRASWNNPDDTFTLSVTLERTSS